MLYCPRCGKGLLQRAKTLTCVPGNMPFSARLDRIIRERYGTGTKTGTPAPASNHRGRWYCPGCGIPIVSKEGITCSKCGKSLTDLLHDLIELHPHL